MENQKQETPKGAKIFAGIFTFSIMLIIFLFIKSCVNDVSEAFEDIPSSKQSTLNVLDPGVAYQYSQGFVKERLKSPATADFPYAYEHQQINDTMVYIASYVDSQNGFGAIIRTNYSCKMVYIKYLDQIQVQSLVMK